MQLLLQRGSKKLLHILTVFVAFDNHHAMRVRHIVICRPSGSQYHLTLSHTRYDFLIKRY
jgi:hypothetical protein